MRDERPADQRGALLAVALDLGPDESRALLARVREAVDVAKVGLSLYGTAGPDLARAVATEIPLFLDLKLHDIPAQVEGAVRSAAAVGASYVTVHASGGREMVAAAVRAARDAAPAGSAEAAPGATRILAVTVLTSLDDDDLGAMGVGDGAEKQVLRLAELALSAGADGLVCSPREVASLRDRFGSDPILLVPGIRPPGGPRDDQKRTMTPAEAAQAGADIVVVGRPIATAPDPLEAARAIRAELDGTRV